MNFEIIPNEQTPRVVQSIMSIDYVQENKEVFEAFLEFAKKQPTAVGLAANQCSLDGERFNQRLFAMKNTKTGEWQLIIDPIILAYVGMKEEKLETCLTWNGKTLLAYRFRAVQLGYVDINGNVHDETHKGFQAQIIQHEMNHLDGIPEIFVPYNHLIKPTREPSRNDKCPCGSGKKYKHCCLLLI